jgi:16S rRNA (adenine1518-N6/adenine1519-N6)-dimethyltransferase
MLQKEVAQRICSGPGSKTYGILSVLLQTYYSVSYLFTVPAGVFSPPPKVMSGVIRLTRNSRENPGCDEELFFRVVKACFNQRLKTLRNSVRAAFKINTGNNHLLKLRPEQLSVDQLLTYQLIGKTKTIRRESYTQRIILERVAVHTGYDPIFQRSREQNDFPQ